MSFKYILPDSKEIHENDQFSLNGYNYPPGWLTNATDDVLRFMNLTKVAVVDPVDASNGVPDGVPESITNYQARAALVNAGLFSTVNAFIKALPIDSGPYQAWEYANNFYRNSPFIASLASQIKLTSEQIDKLFIAASLIE